VAQVSIYANGEELYAIHAMARKHNVIVSIGLSKKIYLSFAALYSSNMVIWGQREVFVHHRKLVPTFYGCPFTQTYGK